MSGAELSAGDDLLVHQLPQPVGAVAGDSESWFDRFYFSLLVPGGGIGAFGASVYPNTGVIDGYACLARGPVQRNLRFSDELGPNRLRRAVGPLSWEVLEPLRSWRLSLGDNPQELALEATWTASGPPHAERIDVPGSGDPEAGVAPTAFAHFFQFGRWHGTLTVAGEELALDGAPGSRDRSWGVRHARERLGMHMWVQAGFDELSLAVHYNEYRDGTTQHCSGVVIPAGGEPDEVSRVEHALEVDEGGELRHGTLRVSTASGASIELRCEGTHTGLYMAGAGYGGWHGVPRGRDHLEHEEWQLDGSHTPRTLALGLTDKPCRFEAGGALGAGVFELALSRSSTYSYAPGGGASNG